MSEDLPELNKVLGPLFTLDVAPFSVDTNVPLPVMYAIEVGIRGSSLSTQGGYVRRFGNGVPLAFSGNNNDLYVNLDNYDLYQKVVTNWTLIGNIKGDDGRSAYEVAIANGFVGDEQDWLKKLYGPQLLVENFAALAELTYTAGQPGTVAAGDYVRTQREDFAYKVAASGATDHNLTTAGGVS